MNVTLVYFALRLYKISHDMNLNANVAKFASDSTYKPEPNLSCENIYFHFSAKIIDF